MTAMDEARQYFADALLEAQRDAGGSSLDELTRLIGSDPSRSTVHRLLGARFMDPPEVGDRRSIPPRL